MKKFQLLLLIQIILCSGILAQTPDNSRRLKPSNFQKRITTIVSGNTRYYYSLSADSASVISVRGPGNLRILTRGRFAPAQEDLISYEIVYTVDGGKPKKVRINDAERSRQATYLNGTLGVPGELRDFEIDLGRGDHSIEFNLKDNKPAVAVQYVFTPVKEKKQDWIEYSPIMPAEPVELITRETTAGYYRFSAGKPVKIEINGPTELRVLTRVEFRYQMQGRVNYRLQVKEADKVLNTYQLSSMRSDVTEYKNNKDLTPGKACEFVIDVPSGKHQYEIVPMDQDKGTLLCRFLLPKTDVKLVK
jgi:hypothetical protein